VKVGQPESQARRPERGKGLLRLLDLEPQQRR
jgi:hypothetical protein